MSSSDSARLFLRHTLATLAYRACKAVKGAPESFGEFHASPDTRTPGQILAHIGQIALLRRLAAAPVRAENYFVAKIAVGTVGPDQPAPVQEFS